MEGAVVWWRDHRHDDAAKRFGPEALRKQGAFEIGVKAPARYRDEFQIMAGAGKAVVLSWQDMPEASNDEFLKLLREFPPALRPDKPDPKAKANVNRGQVEMFFVRNTAGPAWRKAVNDALDRNAKNLGGKSPDGLSRLRLLPAKGLSPKGWFARPAPPARPGSPVGKPRRWPGPRGAPSVTRTASTH